MEPPGANASLSTSRWSPTRRVSSIEPVGITNACTSVVVPNRRRMMVTVHSAINPRGGSALRVVLEPASDGAPGSTALSATTAFVRSTPTIVAANAAILKTPFDDRKSHGQYRSRAYPSILRATPKTHLYGAWLHGLRRHRAGADEIRDGPHHARVSAGQLGHVASFGPGARYRYPVDTGLLRPFPQRPVPDPGPPRR